MKNNNFGYISEKNTKKNNININLLHPLFYPLTL